VQIHFNTAFEDVSGRQWDDQWVRLLVMIAGTRAFPIKRRIYVIEEWKLVDLHLMRAFR
jgi:hypothetical protein